MIDWLIETHVYGLSIGDKSGDLWWTLAWFSGEQKFSTTDISHTVCQSATKFGNVGGSGESKLIPRITFHEHWSRGPVTSCGDMHQFFTDTFVSWFIDNFPTFADGFSVLSIHCVLYAIKCPAEHGPWTRVVYRPGTHCHHFGHPCSRAVRIDPNDSGQVVQSTVPLTPAAQLAVRWWHSPAGKVTVRLAVRYRPVGYKHGKGDAHPAYIHLRRMQYGTLWHLFTFH